LGICNGFQILQEAGLLPGALMQNSTLRFICKDVLVRIESNKGAFTNCCAAGEVLRIPIAHMDGHFYIDKKGLTRMEENGQILFKYCDPKGKLSAPANPNGSIGNIAGVTNREGNVCGLMPHPERCAQELLDNKDGLKIFNSIITHLHERREDQ
jgi:phosphoribosylformylglycinamidine synthase